MIYVKYLSGKITKAFITVVMIVLAIIWLTQSMRFLDLITSKGSDLMTFLKITFFLLIPLAYIVIPIALLIALVIVFHNLKESNELVILKSVGLSSFEMILRLMPLFLVIALFHYVIALYLMPVSYKSFKDFQHEIRENMIFSFFEEGVFNTQYPNLTIYTDTKNPDGSLGGVLIYDSRDSKVNVTITAENGKLFKNQDDDVSFLLINGSRQQEDKATKKISIASFHEYYFSFKNSESTVQRVIDPNELFITELFDTTNKDIRTINWHFSLAVQRIVWPLINIVISIFALNYLLIIKNKRKDAFITDSIILIAGLGFVTCLLIISHYGNKNPQYLIAGLILIVVLISKSLILMRRQ